MTTEKDSNAIVLRPTSLEGAMSFAEKIKDSDMLPAHFKKLPANIAVAMISGMELGFGPMAALRAIHMIEGRPTLSAEALVALTRVSPVCEYFQLKESTNQKATYVTKRRGNPESTTLTFTIDDARVLGVLEKANWKKSPAAMLRARCASGLVHAEYQDVSLGLRSTEEAEDEIFLERSAPIPTEPPPGMVAALKKPEKKVEAEDAEFKEVKQEAKSKVEEPGSSANAVDPNEADAIEEKLAVAFREASSVDVLEMLGKDKDLTLISKDAQLRLRALWLARKKELAK